MTDEAETKSDGVKLRAEAKIVSPKARSTTVSLDWPVEFDGKVYEQVTVRRVSAREVEKFIADVAATEKGTYLKAPMVDCPQEVYEAMDDDDRLRLEGALLPFLPLRLKMGVASTPATAKSTSEQ